MTRSYQSLHRRGHRRFKKHPVILPVSGMLVGLLAVGVVFVSRDNQTLGPSDSHVVYLFNEGKREVLPTRAQTVGELIQKLPLKLIPEDVVEPTLDTPILEDNFRVNIYRARPVTVVDSGGAKIVTLTAQRSPRVVAEQAGLRVNAEDIATFSQGSIKENIIGERVIVGRATPVLLNLYGAQIPTYTQAKTVDGLLKEKKIKLDNGESVEPLLSSIITPNLQVYVLKKGSQVVTTEEAIPPPEQIIGDPSLSFGTSVVRQAGAPGKKAVTYIINSDGGAESGRQLIQEAIIQNAVPKIIARGTTIAVSSDKAGLMSAAGIRESDHGYVNYIISRESGWCPTKWQGEFGSCPPYHGVPTSGGYGLGQATPGGKMASAGADWATNPVTQLKWANDYALRRFGSWAAAYNYWLANHRW